MIFQHISMYRIKGNLARSLWSTAPHRDHMCWEVSRILCHKVRESGFDLSGVGGPGRGLRRGSTKDIKHSEQTVRQRLRRRRECDLL